MELGQVPEFLVAACMFTRDQIQQRKQNAVSRVIARETHFPHALEAYQQEATEFLGWLFDQAGHADVTFNHDSAVNNNPAQTKFIVTSDPILIKFASMVLHYIHATIASKHAVFYRYLLDGHNGLVRLFAQMYLVLMDDDFRRHIFCVSIDLDDAYLEATRKIQQAIILDTTVRLYFLSFLLLMNINLIK